MIHRDTVKTTTPKNTLEATSSIRALNNIITSDFSKSSQKLDDHTIASNHGNHKRPLSKTGDKVTAKERVKNQRLCGQSGIGEDFKVIKFLIFVCL